MVQCSRRPRGFASSPGVGWRGSPVYRRLFRIDDKRLFGDKDAAVVQLEQDDPGSQGAGRRVQGVVYGKGGVAVAAKAGLVLARNQRCGHHPSRRLAPQGPGKVVPVRDGELPLGQDPAWMRFWPSCGRCGPTPGGRPGRWPTLPRRRPGTETFLSRRCVRSGIWRSIPDGAASGRNGGGPHCQCRRPIARRWNR